MRFKIDEHLPVEIKELLTRHQHDAVTVPDEDMTGAIDPDVAQACQPVPDVPPLRSVPVVQTVEPGFRSCDRQKARGATLPQRSRWVSASEQTSISGASRGCRAS